MDISSDYRDLLRTLNKHRVKYLIIGAYAVIYYTEPRFTKDMDILIKACAKNARRLYEALKEFGAPLRDVTSEDFTNKNIVYQIGMAPVRVDIIMGIPGISFDAAWKTRTRSAYGGIPINILGIKELMKSKKRVGRPQDALDVDKLASKIRKHSKSRHGRPSYDI